jgi:hypothetical protein
MVATIWSTRDGDAGTEDESGPKDQMKTRGGHRQPSQGDGFDMTVQRQGVARGHALNDAETMVICPCRRA